MPIFTAVFDKLFAKIINKLAGVVGIEPTLTVLETGVLPLYDTPIFSVTELPRYDYKLRNTELTRDISTCPA